jgi:hypothetical protein
MIFAIQGGFRMNQVKGQPAMNNFSGGMGFLTGASSQKLSLILILLISFASFGGCDSEDCVNCIELPPPVVPTGVHSVSGDDEVFVQWYDISYFPYDGTYTPNVASYAIYSRYYEDDDEYNANREFYYIGEVAWDENFDPESGIHWFTDAEAENGERYEYAVTAVNANGQESALSFELVTDAPLPHSLAPVVLQDKNGPHPEQSGFDFSLIDNGDNPSAPGYNPDIEVQFHNDGIPYVHSARSGVEIQDFGVFIDGDGYLVFEGVSWAPAEGYSNTNVLELIPGHIYVVKIEEYSYGTHYAKFAVLETRTAEVEIVWAYQLISGLPELSVPVENESRSTGSDIISL